MGVINPENTLSFRKTTELFNRVKAFFYSYDSNNLIDQGDFFDYVTYILTQLGAAVYKEAEALVEVKNHRSGLPCNFKLWYAAYKCQRGDHAVTQSINEQNNFGQPWIYMQRIEEEDVCLNKCGIECAEDHGMRRIIVRTFVNGGENEFNFHNPMPLILSPNVKDRCAPNCMRVNRAGGNEVTISDRELRTEFKEGCIYMQYYGLPIDDDYLPMIPDEESIEKAIEYYIYKMLLEKWYINDTVPNVIQKLQYMTKEYDYYFGQARYYCKMPSFQRCIQSIRTMRGNNKFYNFNFDRTVVGHHGGGRWGGWGAWGDFGYGY